MSINTHMVIWVGEVIQDAWDNRKYLGIPFSVTGDKRDLYLECFNTFDDGECDFLFVISEYLGEEEEIFRGEVQEIINLAPTDYSDIEGITPFIESFFSNEKLSSFYDWLKKSH